MILRADQSLHNLLGHPITVAGEACVLADDGLMEVSDRVAEVLLAQHGWSRVEEPQAEEKQPERPRRKERT